MVADVPNVCLTVSNQPENVLLVRETLSGLADTVGVDGVELNDIRTAVTEACNNVVLHAYDAAGGPLHVELYLAPEAVEVVVRDHGKGIDEKYLPRIFERYYKVPGTHDRTGTGLGLSISKEFIEAQGGSIWVDSRIGEGSRFGFSFGLSSNV